MIKRYLNADERFRVVAISAMIGQINETIEKWENLKRSPSVLRYLKTGRTYAKKAIDEIYKEISQVEQERLWRYASETNFGVIVGNTDYKPKDKKKSVYSTDDEEFVKDIAEALIEQNCKHCNKDKCSCTIRRAFEGWEIPPAKTIVSENECQYEY